MHQMWYYFSVKLGNYTLKLNLHIFVHWNFSIIKVNNHSSPSNDRDHHPLLAVQGLI